ncbi:MAG: hypothetical protein C0478_09215 [Planctomyces sp.]|nr:hypothetical protein [Planctomyces sp.]
MIMKRARPPAKRTFKPRTTRVPGEPTTGERLQKVLAAAGYGSRRACEEYIEMGRVTIDGVVVKELGVRVDLATQKVAVDGEKFKPEEKRYFLFHKPAGVLCTNSDPAGRPRVIDFFPPNVGRLFTVGRLDDGTEGLLIVTNDGDLAERLTHPKFGIPRVYRAVVAGSPSAEAIQQLLEGLYFTEGRFRMSSVSRIKSQGAATVLEIVMREGQNREVRRLLARVGHKVMKLKRTNFGPIKLGDLEKGAHRKMTPEELDKLHDVVTGKWKEPAPRKGPQRGDDRKKIPNRSGEGFATSDSPSGSSSDTSSTTRSRPVSTRTSGSRTAGVAGGPMVSSLETTVIPGSKLRRLGAARKEAAVNEAVKVAETAAKAASRAKAAAARAGDAPSGNGTSSRSNSSRTSASSRPAGFSTRGPGASKPASSGYQSKSASPVSRPPASRTTSARTTTTARTAPGRTARGRTTEAVAPTLDETTSRVRRRVLDGEGAVVSAKKLRGAAPKLSFPKVATGNDAAESDNNLPPPPVDLLQSGRRPPRTKDHVIAPRPPRSRALTAAAEAAEGQAEGRPARTRSGAVKRPGGPRTTGKPASRSGKPTSKPTGKPTSRKSSRDR